MKTQARRASVEEATEETARRSPDPMKVAPIKVSASSTGEILQAKLHTVQRDPDDEVASGAAPAQEAQEEQDEDVLVAKAKKVLAKARLKPKDAKSPKIFNEWIKPVQADLFDRVPSNKRGKRAVDEAIHQTLAEIFARSLTFNDPSTLKVKDCQARWRRFPDEEEGAEAESSDAPAAAKPEMADA